MRQMTPCVWRILCLRNSSSVPYFRQPPNLPTAARRNGKCAECGTTAFGRNWMSAESDHLSTFGAETETEAEILSTSICKHFNDLFHYVWNQTVMAIYCSQICWICRITEVLEKESIRRNKTMYRLLQKKCPSVSLKTRFAWSGSHPAVFYWRAACIPAVDVGSPFPLHDWTAPLGQRRIYLHTRRQ